jgi:hypothetical protein
MPHWTDISQSVRPPYFQRSVADNYTTKWQWQLLFPCSQQLKFSRAETLDHIQKIYSRICQRTELGTLLLNWHARQFLSVRSKSAAPSYICIHTEPQPQPTACYNITLKLTECLWRTKSKGSGCGPPQANGINASTAVSWHSLTHWIAEADCAEVRIWKSSITHIIMGEIKQFPAMV